MRTYNVNLTVVNAGIFGSARISLVVHAVLFANAMLLAGCRPSGLSWPVASASIENKGGPVDLAIVGFNYTNREIGSFTVDGIGGGNVAPDGGGGIACCAHFLSRGKPRLHTVRWNSATCRYNEDGEPVTDQSFQLAYSFTEQKVLPAHDGPDDPGYFEVHFLPDGTIKTMITAEMSAPMFSPPTEPKRRLSPPCPGGVRPAE